MSKKITWESIYKDFKSRHPRLRKMVTYWCPHDFVTIKIYFEDDTIGLYDYLQHKLTFTSETWIHKGV